MGWKRTTYGSNQIVEQQDSIDSAAQPFFHSMFLLVAWTLWKERNSVTFECSLVSDATDICKAVAMDASDWALVGFHLISMSASAWSQFLGSL
jgi:hypothetical protein